MGSSAAYGPQRLDLSRLSTWQGVLAAFIDNHALSTQKKYKQVIMEFERETKKNILTVHHGDIYTYASWALRQKGTRAADSRGPHPVARNTVKEKLGLLSTARRKLKEAGHCQDNPFLEVLELFSKDVPAQCRPTGALDEAQVRRMFESQGNDKEGIRNKALAALLFGCALRPGEALSLDLGDIKESAKGTPYIHLRHTKNQKKADVPMQGWVAVLVAKLRAQRRAEGATDDGPLFLAYYVSGLPYPRRASYMTMHDWWRGMLRASALPLTITPHWARTTCINALLSAGIPKDRIRDLTRHSSIIMVEYYERRAAKIDDVVQADLDYGVKVK